MDDKQLKGGLLLLPPDERDFSLGAAYILPKLSELPRNFRHDILLIKNQGSNDKCSAYATCGISELQENVELCPDYSFALSKAISGDPNAWGQNMRTAMQSHQKFGAIEESVSPNVPDPDGRKIENWPVELKDKALIHAKSSYMEVDGPYDHFDNLRAAIWHFRAQKRVPGIGLEWSWPLENQIMYEYLDKGFGHMLYAIGWQEMDDLPYLVVVNSYGEKAGEEGIHYFSREVVNKAVDIYGSFMFVDMTKEEYLERIKPQVQSFIVRALSFIRDLLISLQKQTIPVPAPAPIPPLEPSPTPTPEPESVKDHAYYVALAWKIAGEVSLSPTMKERYLETIEKESGFDPNAKNLNPNGTYDHGIAQFNSKWYIGVGKPVPTVQHAYDPEFSLRVMAKQFKNGHAWDWIAYRTMFPRA